jgi:hypothetical protein
MGTQAIDYQAVINDLERKRILMNAKFDAALAAIRDVIALDTGDEQPILPGVGLSRPMVGQPYKGLPMLDAAMTHIRNIGHAVPNLLLAKQLEGGGYEHKSKNFPNTLNSVLWRRAKTVGDIRKSLRGWELVDLGTNG